jgi:hypothetical protein
MYDENNWLAICISREVLFDPRDPKFYLYRYENKIIYGISQNFSYNGYPHGFSISQSRWVDIFGKYCKISLWFR